MKVAVIGANGQLGTEICRQFTEDYQVVELIHTDIEISDIDNVQAALRKIKPNLVINTAAYHNLPDCEADPVKSFRVNGVGALNLAQLSGELDYTLVNYSTDYVFDGKKNEPYLETDKPNPLNIYALTKLDGETLIKNYCRRYFNIRISGIYGDTVCRAKGKNFITTMQIAAKQRDVVKVVDDEILTPTSVSEIANNTKHLIKTEAYGLYHMTCEGYCSWFEFAGIIFKELRLKTPLISCKSTEFPTSIKRPSYSVLENQKLKTIELNRMSHWRDALVAFLRVLK